MPNPYADPASRPWTLSQWSELSMLPGPIRQRLRGLKVAQPDLPSEYLQAELNVARCAWGLVLLCKSGQEVLAFRKLPLTEQTRRCSTVSDLCLTHRLTALLFAQLYYDAPDLICNQPLLENWTAAVQEAP